MGKMVEDLSNLWGKLSLIEEECEDVVVKDEALVDIALKGKTCLMGKLIVD